MSQLIRKDIAQFVSDLYENTEGKTIEQARKNGLKYSDIIRAVNAVFTGTGSESFNPNHLPLRQYFVSADEHELQGKISSAREYLGLKNRIRLEEWVSFAESIVTFQSDEIREEYDHIFSTGEFRSQIRNQLRPKKEDPNRYYEERDLHFLITNQSGEEFRSIVELTSNAIDFSQPNQEVKVEIVESGYTITDQGSGMNAKTLIEELSIPFISGARHMDTAAIGKFGMGFLTVLRHLKTNGDFVKVQSGNNDKGQEIVFEYLEDGIYVSVGTQTKHTQGTSITVHSNSFKADEATNLLKSHLQYKRGANVVVNSEPIATHDALSYIPTEIDQNKPAVGYKFSVDQELTIANEPANPTPSKKKIVIAINGVTVYDFMHSNLASPELTVLDFPYKTNLAESRDNIVYDKIFVEYGKQIIDAITYDQTTLEAGITIIDHVIDSNIPVKEKTGVCNALAEVFSRLELQTTRNQASVLRHLDEKLSEYLKQNNLTPLPALEGFQYCDQNKYVLVHEKLPKCLDLFYEKASVVRGLRSRTARGYLVDFSENSPVVSASSDRMFVIDRQLFEDLHDHPDFLEPYIAFACRNIDHIHLARPKDMVSNEDSAEKDSGWKSLSFIDQGKQALLDNKGHRYFFSLTQYLFPYKKMKGQFTLNSDLQDIFYRIDLPESYFNDLSNSLFNGDEPPELSHEVLDEALHNLFNHEKFRDIPIPDDLRDHIRKIVYEQQSRSQEIIEEIKRYQSLFALFKEEDLQEIINKEPIEAEREFCIKVFSELEKLFPEETAYVIKSALGSYGRDYTFSWPSQKFETADDVKGSYYYLGLVFERISKDDLYSNEQSIDSAIREAVKNSLQMKIMALAGIRNYMLATKDLSEQEKKSYDLLLSFNWKRREMEPSDPRRIFQYSNRFNSEYRFNDDQMKGLQIITQSIDPSLVQELVSEFVEDPNIDNGDIIFLLSFLTNPVPAYYSLTLDFSRSTDSGSPHKDMVAVLAQEDPEEYAERDSQSRFRGASFSREGIASFDQVREIAELKRKFVKDNIHKLVNRQKRLYALPSISSVMTERGKEVSKQFAKRLEQYIQYPHFKSFHFETALYFEEGSFCEISQKKLDAIEQFASEHFRPEFMDPSTCADFGYFMIRIQHMMNFDDETFEKILPWFNITARHRLLFADEIFSKPVLEVLSNRAKNIDKDQFVEITKIWDGFINNHNRSGDYQSNEEYAAKLDRIFDIVEDISSKPKAMQIFLYDNLRNSESRYTYDTYNLLAKLPEDTSRIFFPLLPYVIYFHTKEKIEEFDLFFPIITDPNDPEINISHLMHTRRTKKKRFQSSLEDDGDFTELITQTESPPNSFVYTRELLHSISHLPADDEYLFIRELLQNSYDASLGSDKESEISINTFQRNDEFVVEINDSVGMDFATVFGKLLQPNVSGKIEGKELGRFGVGFMSIFKDASRVEIQTSNGKEQITVVATPIFDDQNNLIDISISFNRQKSDIHKTKIRKFSRVPIASMERAKVEASVNKYGTYINPEDAKVTCNENIINTKATIVSQRAHPTLGKLEILQGKNAYLLQGRLFVNEIPESVLELIPEYFREIVTKEGIILNIDSSVPLTRSRRDFAHRSQVLTELKSIFPEMIAESIIRGFSIGSINLRMIPYDYFWKDVDFEKYLNSLNPQILEDAEAINNGQSIKDWNFYLSKENLLELLTLIKIVEVGGEKRSLLDINRLRHEDYDFSKDNLPPYLATLIKESEENDKFANTVIESFNNSGEQETPVVILNENLRIFLENVSPAHLAFLKLAEIICRAKSEITQGIVCLPSPLIAAADIFSKVKFWNLLYLQNTIEHLSEIIAKDQITIDDVYSLVGEIIFTSTHEDAHFVEGTYHWASHHNEVFYDRQQRIWDEILLHHKEIIDEIITLLNQSDARILDRRTLSTLLGN